MRRFSLLAFAVTSFRLSTPGTAPAAAPGGVADLPARVPAELEAGLADAFAR